MEHTCEICEKSITFGMVRVTMNRFGKRLCFECQVPEIEQKYANMPKIMEYELKKLKSYIKGTL